MSVCSRALTEAKFDNYKMNLSTTTEKKVAANFLSFNLLAPTVANIKLMNEKKNVINLTTTKKVCQCSATSLLCEPLKHTPDV